MSSIAQVAERAGVSVMTVSRVLRGAGAVSVKTRARVLKAVEQLGYVPSVAARALRSKDRLRATGSNSFALIFGVDTQLADEFFCEVARGAEHEAAGHDLCPLQMHWQADFAGCWPRLRTALSVPGVCGALLAGQFDCREVELISKHVDHIVMVDGPGPVGMGLAAVESDNRGGCQLALERLVGRGCRDVLVLTGPEDHYFSGAMAESARLVSRDGVRTAVVATDYSSEGGRRAILEAWGSGRRYDGVFGNDTLCFGVLRALRELGVDVPGEVKVVGFDNTVHGGYTWPALTSVAIDKGMLGAEGVKCLVELVRGGGEASGVRRVIEARLVERESG